MTFKNQKLHFAEDQNFFKNNTEGFLSFFSQDFFHHLPVEKKIILIKKK